MSVGSSSAARELFTRRDTGHSSGGWPEQIGATAPRGYENAGFREAAYTQIICAELSVHVGNAPLGICLARARWLRRQLKHGCFLALT